MRTEAKIKAAYELLQHNQSKEIEGVDATVAKYLSEGMTGTRNWVWIGFEQALMWVLEVKE